MKALIGPYFNRHLINPTPTLPLPLNGREIATFLPLQGGGREGDGDSSGRHKYVFSIMDCSVLTDKLLQVPLLDRIFYEIGSASEVQFLYDVGTMMFYRVDADR